MSILDDDIGGLDLISSLLTRTLPILFTKQSYQGIGVLNNSFNGKYCKYSVFEYVLLS